jgi:ZIP family zinc transporter
MTSDSSPRQRDLAAGGVGLSLLAAVTLDGVPEKGTSLAGGASATLLLAVFVSNLPSDCGPAAARCWPPPSSSNAWWRAP